MYLRVLGEHSSALFVSALNALVNNCPLLDEVEIGPFLSYLDVTSATLSLFSQCANLKRLSLAIYKVDNVDFVSQVRGL